LFTIVFVLSSPSILFLFSFYPFSSLVYLFNMNRGH
jgi:hypothetical protein